MEDALVRLDRLTQEEVRMAAAQGLKATHVVHDEVKVVDDHIQRVDSHVQGVDDKVQGVDDKVQGVDDHVQQVNDSVQCVGSHVQQVDSHVQGIDDKIQAVDNKVQQVTDHMDDQKRSSSQQPHLTSHERSIALAGDQLRNNLRNWLSPPDPSVNYNTASDARHEGTAQWFIGCDTFKDWKVSTSLLWIYGKRPFPRPSSSLSLIDPYFYSWFGEECPQVRHTSIPFGRDC